MLTHRCLIGACVLVVLSAAAMAQQVQPASSEPVASQAAVQAPAPASVKGPNWSLKLPNTESLVFHGVSNFDKAGGGQGQMAYPMVGGAAGLLVGILTHSALSGAAQDAERSRILKAADNVLGGYQDVLQTLTHRDLMQKSLSLVPVGANKALVEADGRGDSSVSEWAVKSEPVFLITQDQSTLIVENQVVISKANSANADAYKKSVRVVSEVKSAPDLRVFWTQEQGAKLKEETVNLFAKSLELALEDAQRVESSEPKPRKTVRYFEGGEEKMERGEVLDECCGRTLIRTLRGGLMSVPNQRPQKVSASETR